jgi:DNA-binding response OmpR family regulator
MQSPVALALPKPSNVAFPMLWKAMPQTILVADDDPHIREVICFALQQAGFVTGIARDGAACLTAFAAKPADLVILDIGMPELDGLEVCARLPTCRCCS